MISTARDIFLLSVNELFAFAFLRAEHPTAYMEISQFSHYLRFANPTDAPINGCPHPSVRAPVRHRWGFETKIFQKPHPRANLIIKPPRAAEPFKKWYG